MHKYVRKSGKTTHTSRQRCESSKVFSTEKAVSCQQKVWTEGEDWKRVVQVSPEKQRGEEKEEEELEDGEKGEGEEEEGNRREE